MYQSVGASVTKYLDIQEPLELESGAKIGPLRIAYETYGRLNKDRSNAILVCHPLSGDAHAAGFHDGESKPGWWDIAIGPGKGFDTTKFFVICSNVLGGCKGTTGPSSIDPATGRPYGTSFPVVTIKDMVNVQKMLVDRLGITQLFAVAGVDGGMWLQWAVSYPEMMRKAVVMRLMAPFHPTADRVQRRGEEGHHLRPCLEQGRLLRQKASIGRSVAGQDGGAHHHLSDESMLHKFGRNLQGKETVGFDFSTDFQVESYLNHQGDSFIKRFDPNSYLYITKAIDYFDLNVRGSLITGLSGVKAEVLVIGISSDWLYPPYQSQEIVTALRANGLKAFYGEIRSNYGHDAFLLEQGQLNYLLKSFLDQASAGDVMSRAAHTIREDTTIEKAAELMIRLETNHLPVVSPRRRLIGIVTS